MIFRASGLQGFRASGLQGFRASKQICAFSTACESHSSIAFYKPLSDSISEGGFLFSLSEPLIMLIFLITLIFHTHGTQRKS